jgi:TonB family protein
MCCKKFWLRIVPFSLALVFGLLIVNVLQKANEENIKPLDKIVYSGLRTATSSYCPKKSFETSSDDTTTQTFSSETKPLQIISKPRAIYTDAARQNQVQGTVSLRVTFTASGEIGSISPISNLPHGLTEQAISAAREIKFEPAVKNGIPQTVTKQVQYSFMLY